MYTLISSIYLYLACIVLDPCSTIASQYKTFILSNHIYHHEDNENMLCCLSKHFFFLVRFDALLEDADFLLYYIILTLLLHWVDWVVVVLVKKGER